MTARSQRGQDLISLNDQIPSEADLDLMNKFAKILLFNKGYRSTILDCLFTNPSKTRIGFANCIVDLVVLCLNKQIKAEATNTIFRTEISNFVNGFNFAGD